MQRYGLSPDGRTITLERFDGGVDVEANGEAAGTLLVVDVETTGLDPTTDRMIEFAAAQVRYDWDGRIVQHVKTVNWLEDPGFPIPEAITDLTGIRDEDVAGQQIPASASALFAKADLIVSHNASFDWAFCRARWPDALDGKLWGCSLQQIDWSDFPSPKQEILTRYHGFFYEAHRATIDVEALIRLLQCSRRDDAKPYLYELLQEVEKPAYRILAYHTPYSAKDDLKNRRYRWDSDRRVWWTVCTAPNLPAEQAWLDELYERYNPKAKPTIQPIVPSQRWA